MMIHRIARYRVRAKEVERVSRAVRALVSAVAVEEPGTPLYRAYLEPDGVTFLHAMDFVDEAAEAAHRDSPHVRRFVEEVYPLCEVPPAFVDLRLVATTP